MMNDKTDLVSEVKAPLPNITPEMRNVLRGDFPDEAYKKHESKTYLSTLKAMYIVERLNDVFLVGRWTVEHTVVSSDNNYVLMHGRLKIFDYDCHIPIQYGGHATSGTGKEKADGYKSAITDILSKSASYIEIGIDLFKGKIQAGGPDPSGQGDKEKPPEIQRQLTKDEVDNKWNGKLYGKSVFINNQKITPPKDQLEKLKSHPKYKPSDRAK